MSDGAQRSRKEPVDAAQRSRDENGRWRSALEWACGVLEMAGIACPRGDAEYLMGHVLGISRNRLPLVTEFSARDREAFSELVRRRARRVPLQHLTGVASLGPVDVAVGPGVFVPRPETELLYSWTIDQLSGRGAPIVVDLCAGSGALALAVAHARPDAIVHAVELDPVAARWAQCNARLRAAAGDRPVTVHIADATDVQLVDLLGGRADAVVANPPYLPNETNLEPEVAQHDPWLSLFGGADGLEVIADMIPVLTRLLAPGGIVAVEHDDSNGSAVAAMLNEQGFSTVIEHLDLAGKPRFVTAVRDDAKMAV